ncbi:MAG TPA: hypothetical protein PKA20_02040 [Burkholderiaceae bacterium]|nr:hypothetical protein [Burkholderiaceae bacterium]
MKQAYVRRDDRGVYLCDASALDWQTSGKGGIMLRPVRFDGERGEFLGLVGFEPMVRSGTHQHQDVATSYFIDGSLTDYQGQGAKGEVGINLRGATHDAIAYCRTLLVSRLDGPVSYLPEEGPVFELHAGARAERFENPDPDAPADLMVHPDQVAVAGTGVAGVGRRMLFDYAGTGEQRRFVQLMLRPGAVVPRLRVSARTEFWVQAGIVDIDGRLAHGNHFGILEPGTETGLTSRFGARLLVWADGPSVWVDREGPELFGF